MSEEKSNIDGKSDGDACAEIKRSLENFPEAVKKFTLAAVKQKQGPQDILESVASIIFSLGRNVEVLHGKLIGRHPDEVTSEEMAYFYHHAGEAHVLTQMFSQDVRTAYMNLDKKLSAVIKRSNEKEGKGGK